MTAPTILAASIHGNFPATASLSYQSSFGMCALNNTTTGLSTAQNQVNTAGTINNLYVRVPTNTRTTNSTITLHKNGSATSLVATITGSATGTFSDISNSVSVAVADNIGLQYAQGSGSGSTFVNSACATFTPSSGTSQHIGAGSGTNAASTSTATRYTMPVSVINTNSTENTQSQVKLPIAGVASGMNINVTANSWTSTTAIRFRKNAANVNQTISVPSATTGIFADISNTDAIAVGDLVIVSVIPAAGSGSITWLAVGFTFTATTDTESMLLGRCGSVSGATRMLGLAGNTIQLTTDANAQQVLGVAGTVDLIGWVITVNTSGTTGTVTFRKNGSNGNGTFTFGAGATGTFQDVSNNDTFAATDLLNYQVTGHNNTIAVSHTFARLVTSAIGGGGATRNNNLTTLMAA